MLTAKYVIINGSAIVFSAAINHSDMVKYGQKCEGAGYVNFEVEKDSYNDYVVVAKCYGKSVSLDISSRDLDSDIVTRQLCKQY